MEFTVFDGEQAVGKADVIPEGMTYRIKVVCIPLSGAPEIIEIKHESGELELGYCTKEGTQMVLVKRIAKRELPGYAWLFGVKHAKVPAQSKFLKEGVDSIAALRNARLEIEGDDLKIIYDSQNSKPTGQ